MSVNRGGQWTSFTTFHFIPSGWLGNCMSKIKILFVITFVSKKIETWDQCQSIEGDSGHLSQPSILPLLVEKGIACPKLTLFFVITFYIRETETWINPVSVNRGGQWPFFTTFHFMPTGRKGNCMSKINLLFVITFYIRESETRDQCQSIEGESGHFFTTFHFIPSGWLGNCMSKIKIRFVITFVSKKIETWDQCQSIEGDSGHLSQPSILSQVAD